MKIETLKERIEKATAKIERKENTIVKKTAQIEKKKAALAKMGYPEITKTEYYELGDKLGDKAHNIYWTLCDIDNLKEDIVRGRKEIEATKQTLAKYEAQLTGEIERESIILKDIPEVFKTLQNEMVTEWDAWDKERRDSLKKAYAELGYREFMKTHTRADYNFRYLTDEEIHNSNVNDAKTLILDFYYRVKDVTGEVTNWEDLRPEIGTHGFTVLNGYVEGKEGRAQVESILAGGYNIQRLHVRVLVKSI